MIYSAGSGTLDGHLLRRIEAEGRTGVHEWLHPNEARVSTALTKRRERFTRPLTAKCLLKALPDQIGRSVTKFQLSGKLEIMPRTNSKTNLHLNTRVSAREKEESQSIRFTQTRNQTRHRVDLPSQ